MIDLLQQRSGAAGVRRRRDVEWQAERRRIAHGLALGEMIAEEVRNDQVLCPPAGRRQDRRPDRRAWVEGGEVTQGEVERPGPQVRELGKDGAANRAALRM